MFDAECSWGCFVLGVALVRKPVLHVQYIQITAIIHHLRLGPLKYGHCNAPPYLPVRIRGAQNLAVIGRVGGVFIRSESGPVRHHHRRALGPTWNGGSNWLAAGIKQWAVVEIPLVRGWSYG